MLYHLKFQFLNIIMIEDLASTQIGVIIFSLLNITHMNSQWIKQIPIPCSEQWA